MPSSNINLLKTRTGSSPELVNIEYWSRYAGLAALGIVLVAGVLLGTGYIWLTAETTRLEAEKTALTQQIVAERTKEGLLLSIKQRAALAEKVLAIQRSMASVVDIARTIAPGDQLVSVAVDEQQQIQLVATTSSVEESARVVSELLRLTEENRVVSPQLVALEVDKNGNVRLTVSFVQSVVSG